jgi:hypothetical protein
LKGGCQLRVIVNNPTHQNIFKKGIAMYIGCAIVRAPRHPKRLAGQHVCEPITVFPPRDRIDGSPTSKVAGKNFLHLCL